MTGPETDDLIDRWCRSLSLQSDLWEAGVPDEDPRMQHLRRQNRELRLAFERSDAIRAPPLELDLDPSP